MVAQARRPAPDHHVAVAEGHPQHGVGPPQAAEEKDGRQAQGDRDNRCPKIVLIAILAVSLVVYEWSGLAFLRRGWINFDRLWTAALAGSGVLLLVT